MSNLILVGIVLASAVGAIAASILCVAIVWAVVDRCEDFSKNPWDENL